MASGKSKQKHKVCFGKDCPAEKFKNYEFCSTCFRQGCGSGNITAKDGNRYTIVAFSESDPAAKENRMKNNEIIRAGANKWRTGHAYNVDVAPRMVEDEREMEQAAREYAMSTWSDVVSGAKRGRRNSEDDGRGDEKRVDTGMEAELAYDVADTEDKHTREAMMAQLEKTMALAQQ